MAFYDIFNGDADGLCALHQLRMVEPRAATLVTGAKREVQLLRRVSPDRTDRLTVLDISLDTNRDDLHRVLRSGASCVWIDHHYTGAPIEHGGLHVMIDSAPGICTSLIVDRMLGGRHRKWAVVAAFGDNLPDSAMKAAQVLQLNHAALESLRRLGQRLNYNAYGDSVEDLHFHPVELYRRISRYTDPLQFMRDDDAFRQLDSGFRQDLKLALSVTPLQSGDGVHVVQLPDLPWARRASGELANHLAREKKHRAVAVLTPITDGNRVSVRAPLTKPTGADRLCLKFDTGGGRPSAAGINLLREAEMDRFLGALQTAFGGA